MGINVVNDPVGPPTWLQASLPGLAGIAGAIPTPSSGSGSGSSSSNGLVTTGGQSNTNTGSTQSQSGTTDTSGTNSLATLLNTLSQLTNNQTTTSGFGQQGQDLISQLLPALSKLTGQSTNLAPYLASQTENINRNSGLANQSAQAIMAARGLSNSPVGATTAANIDANRIAQITGLQQSLPLLQNQLQNTNLSTAANVLNLLPKTTTTSGTQSTTGTQSGTNTGTSIGQTVANTVGRTNGFNDTSQNTSQSTNQNQNYNQNQQQQSGGGVGGAIGGVASALASLFL